MIRFKDKVFEDYFIDHVTAVITDKKGVVQKVILHQGWLEFKNMRVHCIQVHTHLGYIPHMSIHHKDFNKLNNSLDNLMYITQADHLSLHNRCRDYKALSTEQKNNISSSLRNYYASHTKSTKGKPLNLSDEARRKLSKRAKNNSYFGGHKHSNETKEKLSAMSKGRFWWNNAVTEILSRQCPGEGWVHGRIKHK